MSHNSVISINLAAGLALVAFIAGTVLSRRDNAGAAFAGVRVNCGGYIMSREAR